MYRLYSTFMICTHYIASLSNVPTIQHYYDMYPKYSMFMIYTQYTAPLWYVPNYTAPLSYVPIIQHLYHMWLWNIGFLLYLHVKEWKAQHPARLCGVWHQGVWGEGDLHAAPAEALVRGQVQAFVGTVRHHHLQQSPKSHMFIIAIHKIIWHCRLRVFLFVSVSFV